jgi:hypothetical protein
MAERRPIDSVFPARYEAVKAFRCVAEPIGCGREIVKGEFDDKESAADYEITGLCQTCQDEFYLNEHTDPDEITGHPLPGNELMYIENLNNTGGYIKTGRRSRRIVTEDLTRANVVTSRRSDDSVVHRPVLDIDFPVKVVESSTPGHCHLYIDRDLEWDDYVKLLEVLGEVGILEPGYVSASLERGFTALRLPWVRKPGTEPLRANRSEWTSPDTWRDPDCIECGGDGAPCCEPPNHPYEPTTVVVHPEADSKSAELSERLTAMVQRIKERHN